jgi:hypothetical protein
MLKSFLLNSILKELMIIRRLATKIPAQSFDYKPKEGIRSTLELLQYLSWCGTGTIQYWYRNDDSDFKTYFIGISAKAKETTAENFDEVIQYQIKLVDQLFENISENDLFTKEVDYPWGEKALLGQAIIETNIKWLTAYKLQLFSYIKYNSEEKLVTPDAWRKTEIE